MWLAMAAGLAGALTAAQAAAEIPELLQAIRAVDHEGAGHAAAQRAVRELVAQGPAGLVPTLTAMNGANPLAANWLRGAFESVAERSLRSEAGLPVDELLAFFQQRAHDPRARRLAYEWAVRAKPALADELIPLALDDPSAEMRRDAVARLLTQARAAQDASRIDEAAQLYQQALSGAGEPEQVDPIVKALEPLGKPVDLVAHYGLVTEWHVIGPFDNREMKGFPVVYPPETEIKLDAAYPGKEGEVRWEPLKTTAADGAFDLATLTKPHKGAIDYVTTVFHSDAAQPVEFRLGTANAWKLWLNGELLFAREEYHRGMRFDQYRVAGTLRPGANRILIKVCQNEQDQEWAQKWSFQFRVCDPYGRPVKSAPARDGAGG